MNTAILYDDPPFDSEYQEVFETMVAPMLNLWLPAFRKAADAPGLPAGILEYLKNAALMAWLPAKGNIPVTQRIIENFREIFLIVRFHILENPAYAGLDGQVRSQLEKFNLRLAKAVTVLDIANDPGIAELFPDVQK